MPKDLFDHTPVESKPGECAELLDQTRWANRFSWQQITMLANYLQLYNVKKNAVIFDEGCQEQVLGIIIKGSLNITKKDDYNNDNILSTLNTSQSFGEMSFIDGQPASARVTAATDTQLLILTKGKFDDLAGNNSSLALQLILYIAQMLSQRLRSTSGKLVDYLAD